MRWTCSFDNVCLHYDLPHLVGEHKEVDRSAVREFNWVGNLGESCKSGCFVVLHVEDREQLSDHEQVAHFLCQVQQL